MSLLNWQTATIDRIVHHNSHTRSYFFSVDATPVFDFTPGQFVTFDLPIAERPSQRMRSYSIASNPAGDNTFEIVISHKPHGAGTGYFFDHCVEGSSLRFRGPQGTFVLPAQFDRPLVLICTGTGIAPFRSQIKQLLAQQVSVPEIHLVFGTRTLADAIYVEEMASLAKTHPHFHYHLTLSRPDAHWTGNSGYVHEIYTRISDQGKRDMDFYLCGWRNMVSDARKHLELLGYAKERVHLEMYD
ncbi:MAG TPA: FAD-dependent oxidoreductase [Chitinophagales bacterium]|nr:FAD-dependent oxidoreductase [Chitinophagales bacterium]